MLLKEIAVDYRHNSQLLLDAINKLKCNLETTSDPDLISKINYDIKYLRNIRRESNELAVLCERYYERGHHRNERYQI